MPLFARIAFAAVDFAARKGLAAPAAGDSGTESRKASSPAHGRSRRDVRVLVSSAARLRGGRAKLYVAGHEGRD